MSYLTISDCGARPCPSPARRLGAMGVSGLAGEAIMVAGYFGYACLWLGRGWAAAASVPGNVIQGAVGLGAAGAVYWLLSRSRALAALPR